MTPKRLLKQLLGWLPSRLPIGNPQLDAFCSDIFNTYGIPDLPSYKQAICKMILQLPPTSNSKPKRWFAVSMFKAQSNETAYAVLEEQVRLDGIRIRAEKQAAEEARQAALLEVASETQAQA